MKQELEGPEAGTKINKGGPHLMAIDWSDFKSATPVSVEVIEKSDEVNAYGGGPPPAPLVVSGLVKKAVAATCQTVLFGLGLKKRGPEDESAASKVKKHLGLVVLFALAIGFAGCVGYVGPGPGVAVYGPDVAVFGGGYYHGHYAHAYSVRGGASRGWHR